MADKITTTKVVLFSEKGPVKKLVTNAVKKLDEFQLISASGGRDDWANLIREERPEIGLIEYEPDGKRNKASLDDISRQFPNLSIVAILPDDDPGRAQEVLLSGARAFVVQPLKEAELRYTLERVRELQGRAGRAQVAESATLEATGEYRTYAVFSPRGGVGASLIATNLALALNENSDKNVLLIDGKQYFGHLDIMLNLQSRNSIGDLIPFAQRLDSELISDIVSVHSSGLHVLPSPLSFDDSQALRPDSLYSILQTLQTMYGHIVIDTGSALNENAVTLMDAAFRVLLVLNPELASLHNAREFLGIGQSLNFPDDKVLMVLNRADMKDGIRVKQIEDALPLKLFAKIPEDIRNAIKSVNQGVPLHIKNPKSPIVKALDEMSKKLMDLTKKEIRVSLQRGEDAE
jgi:pilus assembly protein CpaE